MNARDVMTTNMVFCDQDTTLEDAAKLMASYNCGALPVVDGFRKVVGIITDRDIVCRAVASGMDTKTATTGECMTTHVYVANEKDALDKCRELMEEHHVRRVPIVDESKYCCGIVTLTNLALSLAPSEIGKTVKEIEKTDLEYLVPGKEPETASEVSIYGAIRPQYFGPQNLPLEVPQHLPSTGMQLYYDAYNRAHAELTNGDRGDLSPEELRKSCERVAMSALRQKYKKVGDRWVPKV
jgi:CBS domain-containing protein/cation transport regulator ChaB